MIWDSMAKKGLVFSQVSNPQSFVHDPCFGWGFYGHRYHLYTNAKPHKGYQILNKWASKLNDNRSFVFTSNVDGHFELSGFEGRMVECHGSIHYLQAFDNYLTNAIWPAKEQLAKLEIDSETFLAKEPLPTVPESILAESKSKGVNRLARPNILMFGDYGFIGDRVEEQYAKYDEFIKGLKKTTQLVIVEIGAGLAVPTVRHESESLTRKFPNSTLIRINPREPQCTGVSNAIELPMNAKECLEMIDESI